MGLTAFQNRQRIGSGTATELAAILQTLPQGQILVFEDSTGTQVDFPFKDSAAKQLSAPEVRSPGRPKLGVIAREVTLLPRHWDWLNLQPGGASVALRKLVDEARRTNGDRNRNRVAQEAAYRFMYAIAGNLPGFEEATRALFACDRHKFTELVAGWPEDVRDYAVQLAFSDQA